MPNSKVVQAELTPEGAVAVTVQLSHLAPGEKALVQTTVIQANTIGDATLLVSGTTPAGPHRVQLVVTPRSGTFTHDADLATFTQASIAWASPLKPLPAATPAKGHPPRLLWAEAGSGWPGMD